MGVSCIVGGLSICYLTLYRKCLPALVCISITVDLLVVKYESQFDSLRPHVLQHARLFYPSVSPRIHSSSCPLSWGCHPIVSSSVASFSSCPQSFPASRSFPMNQLFTINGQSIRASASASVLPMRVQG